MRHGEVHSDVLLFYLFMLWITPNLFALAPELLKKTLIIMISSIVETLAEVI